MKCEYLLAFVSAGRLRHLDHAAYRQCSQSPAGSGSDGDSCTTELATHRRGVDIERQRNRGEGVSTAVATGDFADVMVAHLAAIHSTGNAA